MKRVFGLETEYGITLSGAESVDVVAESIELVRRYTENGALMKWDYELEDPHLDARGFRARELLQDTDESAYYEIDKRRPSALRKSKAISCFQMARAFTTITHTRNILRRSAQAFGRSLHRTKQGNAFWQSARDAETRSCPPDLKFVFTKTTQTLPGTVTDATTIT